MLWISNLTLNLHYYTAGAVCEAQRPPQRPVEARRAVERIDVDLCTGGRWSLPYAYTTVSKQAGAFRVHSTFRTCFNYVYILLYLVYIFHCCLVWRNQD